MTSMSTTEWTNTGIMDPGERIKRFGIECVGPQGDGILFAAGHWKPGGEYVQKLIVRNVTTSVKKVKYKLPSTRYFSLAYPEVIVLSPGMFTELDVVFRPVVYDPYDDFILFRMQDGPGSGEFRVPVRALISKLQVSSPFGVDLGFSATHQTTSRMFQLDNFGEVDAPFRWDVPYPFKLVPSEGIIPIGQKQDIEVSIVPTDASVFVSEAVCHVGEGVHAIIPEPALVTKLSAIGKYTYIVLSENLVEFGEVLSGTPAETFTKEIILRNQGVVPAEFELIRHDNDRDEVFRITPSSGVVPTQSEITITVSYTPLASGCYSMDKYTFRTPGDCRAVFTCSGTSMSPKVTLFRESRIPGQEFPEGAPANSINFRDVCVGSLETRLFYLKNHSNTKVAYSILIDDEATFKMTPRQGVISALMEAPVKISFSPTCPINYCRRVFILVGDALPLFVDLMGTGFIRAKGEIKEQRPAPLRHAHIQAYRNRCTAGVGDLNPDELDVKLEEEGMSDLFAQVGTAGTRAVSVAMLRNPLTRTGEASRVDVAPSHELFIDDTEPFCRGVTLDTTYMDFGFTQYQTSSQSRSVTLTNKTRGKLAIMWFPPRVHGDYDTDATSAAMGLDLNSPVFSVEPAISEISPGASQKYKVTFHPLQSNRGFISEIEVVAFFKNQRTFRLVNDQTLTPPWCSVLRATGHTFATGQLMAKVGVKSGAVKNGKLVFPACYFGDSVFQTVRITNSSNLPAIFKIELGFDDSGLADPEMDSVFTVKPDSGEIAAEDFAMVCIKFTPKTRKKVLQLMRCIVNGSLGGQILLEGVGAIPQLCCPDVIEKCPQIGQLLPARPYGQEFFCLNPTSVGLSSSREFRVRNCSRLPLRFYCSLPPIVHGIIDVSPTYGFLRGNGETNVTISFAPKAIELTQCKMEIEVLPVGGKPSKVIDARQPGTVAPVEALQKFKVNIVAQGGMGAVVFDPSDVDASVKLVNTQETKHIVLENVCDSVLEYELHYRMEFTPEPGSESTEKLCTPVQRMMSSATSTNGSAEYHQSLFCEAPEGLLQARSRRTVLFTFQPNRAGLFQFVVCVRLRSVDIKGNPLTVSNEQSALLHAAEMRLQKQMEGAEGLDDISGLPLTMCVTGRASFPTLKIEDIRTDVDTLISDVRNLWQQFSVPEINHEMNSPLTDEEVHFNTISSPDLNTLKRYQFRFTPDVIGSPRQVIYLQLRNSGFLTTAWKMSLPNEKELDLEHWCDEDELTEERLTFISILEELKCFEMEPREGTLAPGEGVVITLSYSHSSLKYNGYHRLPVHIKLSQGKQFWIDMIGITLGNTISQALVKVPSSSQSVAVTTLRNQVAEKAPNILLFASTGSNGDYYFKSVPIGVPIGQLPLQRMELTNVSALDIIYEIDLSSIRTLQKANFEQKVLEVLNPKGVIAARSSTFIEWIFRPLEAIEYTAEISIRYFPESIVQEVASTTNRRRSSTGVNGSNLGATQVKSSVGSDGTNSQQSKFLTLVLHGQGYDIRHDRPPPPGSLRIGATAPTRRIVEIDSMASLSQDFVDFGVVPKTLSASRLVVLRNHSSSEVEFSVDESSCYTMSIDTLTIVPDRGKIEPFGLVVLDVTLNAMCQPLIVNDRVKIIVQSVIKPVVKRGGGSRHDKIKEKLRSRGKIGTASHSEVVRSPTASRSKYMESVEFRDGTRTASYPTSMSKTASVALTASNSKTSVNGGASAANLDSFSFGTTTGGANLRTVSSPGSFAGGSRNGSTFLEDAKSLRGPAEVLTLRLEGEIYSLEVISTLFDKGPQKGILETFVLPTDEPFVPPRSASSLPGGTLRVGTGVADERELSRQSSRGGTRPVPASERQYEVRAAVDCILGNIFRDVLNNSETKDMVSELEWFVIYWHIDLNNF